MDHRGFIKLGKTLTTGSMHGLAAVRLRRWSAAGLHAVYGAHYW
jgi:hypothetical protein